MYRAYESELFRFDQLYRHFCEYADVAASTGLGHRSSRCGSRSRRATANWYRAPSSAWPGASSSSGGLLDELEIDEVPNQHEFYERHVQPRLEEAENRRAFVIISDAFRYEVAQELDAGTQRQVPLRGGASSQLGVLPSYTALGMASLLPHKTLEYNAKGDVLVDGKPRASLDQRSEILAAVDGMAVKADDLLAMKKEEGREFVAGKRVVYIYHDEIDAAGDKASTEGDTFEAVRKAIDEARRPRPVTSSTTSTATTWSSPPTTASCSRRRRPARPTRASWTTSQPAR